jgi:hypothetical protein
MFLIYRQNAAWHTYHTQTINCCVTRGPLTRFSPPIGFNYSWNRRGLYHGSQQSPPYRLLHCVTRQTRHSYSHVPYFGYCPLSEQKTGPNTDRRCITVTTGTVCHTFLLPQCVRRSAVWRLTEKFLTNMLSLPNETWLATKPGLWSRSRKEFWVESESVKMYRLRPRYEILNRY